MVERRKDSKGRVLKTGESQRKDGRYDYRWRTSNGKRMVIYAKTLEELREMEEGIQRDKSDGIRTDARRVTVNDEFELWKDLKRGLKDNTFQNYIYMYETFIAPEFGQLKLKNLKRSDVRRFYNMLLEERNLKISTIDNIHTVLHQVLEMAVEDDFLRKNPADNMMKELKQANNLGVEKKKALTRDEEKLFLNFLEESHQYHHWKPIFEVMLGSGLRVGEVTGLRWEDLDFENGFISVNHTLVYYQHVENGCYFGINTPKTKAGIREVPMLSSVREAFLEEKEYQEAMEITCKAKIDGYTNFVFVNRFGNVQHQGTLNKALRRIMRDCNEQILEKNPNAKNLVLLPRFSCHILRHTFATRLCEEGVNMKVIQDVLGHSDIGTTMNIYADATRELKTKELGMLEDYFSKKKDEDTDAGEEGEKQDMVIDVVQINK